VKPRLFLDEERFRSQHGQGYLVTAGDGGLGVEGSRAVAKDDLRLVAALVNAAEGLPIRLGDLG